MDLCDNIANAENQETSNPGTTDQAMETVPVMIVHTRPEESPAENKAHLQSQSMNIPIDAAIASASGEFQNAGQDVTPESSTIQIHSSQNVIENCPTNIAEEMGSVTTYKIENGKFDCQDEKSKIELSRHTGTENLENAEQINISDPYESLPQNLSPLSQKQDDVISGDATMNNMIVQSGDNSSDYYIVVENPDGTQVLSRVLSGSVMLNDHSKDTQTSFMAGSSTQLTASTDEDILKTETLQDPEQASNQAITVVLDDRAQLGVSNLLLDSSALPSDADISQGTSSEMLPIQFSYLTDENGGDIVNFKTDDSVVTKVSGLTSKSLISVSALEASDSTYCVGETTSENAQMSQTVLGHHQDSHQPGTSNELIENVVLDESTNSEAEKMRHERLLQERQDLIRSHLAHHLQESSRRKVTDDDSGELSDSAMVVLANETADMIKTESGISDSTSIFMDLTTKINEEIVNSVPGCQQFLLSLSENDDSLCIDKGQWLFTGDIFKLISLHNAIKGLIKIRPKSFLRVKTVGGDDDGNDKAISCRLLVPYLSSKGRMPRRSNKFSEMGVVNLFDSEADVTDHWTGAEEEKGHNILSQIGSRRRRRKQGRPKKTNRSVPSKKSRNKSKIMDTSTDPPLLIPEGSDVSDPSKNMTLNSGSFQAVTDEDELSDPVQRRLREEQMKCKAIMEKRYRQSLDVQIAASTDSVVMDQQNPEVQVQENEQSQESSSLSNPGENSNILAKRRGRPPKKYDQYEFLPSQRVKPRNPLTESASTKQQRTYEEHMSFKFFCSQCSFKSRRHSHYLKHLKCHNSGSEKFTCSQCDFVSISQTMLKRHELTHKEDLFKCSICAIYNTDRKELLLRHIKCKHSKALKEQLHCQDCNFVGKTIKQLETHKQKKHNQKTLPKITCKMCDKVFLNRIHLGRHLRDVHGPNLRPHLCDLCGKAFKRTDALQQHKLVHMGRSAQSLRFKCETCSKAFRSAAHLKEHKSMHSSERPFLCQYCGASFKTQPVQKKHILTLHIKPRTHVCSVCCRQFNTKNALQRHEAVHTKNNAAANEAAAAVLELQISGKKLDEGDTGKIEDMNTLEGPPRATLRVGRAATITVNGQQTTCLVQDLIDASALTESVTVDHTGQPIAQNFIQGTQSTPALYYLTEELQQIE